METLAAAGVPCSACLDTVELHNDPHLLARKFVKTVAHPNYGAVPLLGFPPRLSDSEVSIKSAPLLGQHTQEVLLEDLSLEPAELETLEQSGVIKRFKDADH
jgi:formyl-CoA transferase